MIWWPKQMPTSGVSGGRARKLAISGAIQGSGS